MKLCTVSVINIVFFVGLGVGFISCYSLLQRTKEDSVWNERKSLLVEKTDIDSKQLRPELKASGSGAKCLNFEDSFDELVASSSSVYLNMPSKAASTSFATFVQSCVGFGTPDLSKVYKIETEEERTANIFMRSFKHPQIIHNHIFNPLPLIRLLEQTPRDSLIIYSHREETDRLISAARHIITEACNGQRLNIPETEYEVIDKQCVFNEAAIVDLIIKPKLMELDGGAPDILTCELYEAIEANFPRMVFVHYKQAEKVQKLLSKYHCPDLEQVFHENSAEKKDIEVLVKRRHENKLVALEDWLEAKRDKVEWTFNYNRGNKCRGKTRKMEDDLFACRDEIIQVTRDTSF